MNRLLRSHLAAGNFDGTVRDDFVHVHVGLRAAAGLPDAQRKLIVQFARNHLVRSLHDQLRLVSGQFAQILIHQRAGLLQYAEGANQLRRHGVAADVEMQQRALCLRSPVDVGRDFDFPHAVGFDAHAGTEFGGGWHKLS